VKILITGAAGNLGSQLVHHLMTTRHELRLLLHRSPFPFDVTGCPNISVCRADLAQPDTLEAACQAVDCVVHFAGVLFAPRPEKFLPLTNVGFVKNLVQKAQASRVRRFILISFPQVEGETTPDHPAFGRLDASPRPIHFRTRLEAEKYLIDACAGTAMIPVVFRSGMVYGREVKMIEGARWMLRHRLMAIWQTPTWIHLISLPDFLAALQVAIEKETVSGIYQVCDDQPLTLQEFLDRLAAYYGCPRAWRLPRWMFETAAVISEMAALIFRTVAPLNRDIIKAGMTSCVADNSRMKRELLPLLAYPTLDEGIHLV